MQTPDNADLNIEKIAKLFPNVVTETKDDDGNTFEYKVSKNHSWNFQDISENVLEKYKSDKSIILAVVNKQNLVVTNIYSADSAKVA